MKKKTICDAIKEVLKDEKDGLTYLEIHSQIEEKNYDAELLGRGFEKEQIRHYGFAFKGKEVLIG